MVRLASVVSSGFFCTDVLAMQSNDAMPCHELLEDLALVPSSNATQVSPKAPGQDACYNGGMEGIYSSI